MGRTVALSSLTEAEKDRALLVLHGLAKSQRELLRQHAERSPSLKRELEQLEATYGPRLWILDRAYVRETTARHAEKTATRNQQRWDRLPSEVPA